MGYIFIAFMIVLTAYGQLIIKSQVSAAGEFPLDTGEKIAFILRLLLNPLVLSGLAAAFLASLAWMAALTQFDLSHAYPFTSLTFVIVMLASVLLFDEPFSWSTVGGTLLIIMGLAVIAR